MTVTEPWFKLVSLLWCTELWRLWHSSVCICGKPISQLSSAEVKFRSRTGQLCVSPAVSGSSSDKEYDDRFEPWRCCRASWCSVLERSMWGKGCTTALKSSWVFVLISLLQMKRKWGGTGFFGVEGGGSGPPHLEAFSASLSPSLASNPPVPVSGRSYWGGCALWN